jgi:hypothetical protein
MPAARVRAVLAASTLAVTVVPLAVLAAPAQADTGGWQRYRAASFTAGAGTLCPFALHSAVVFDREYVRTTATFPDGSPRSQEFAGPLVVRLTNLQTSRSVRRDLSARAVVRYAADGSYDLFLQGPAAVGFHPGDGLPPGYDVLRGTHTVHVAADGTRTLTRDGGTEEDVCRTLA